MRLMLLCSLMILSGCVSGYSKFYIPFESYGRYVEPGSLRDVDLRTKDDPPVIVRTNDINAEVDRFLSKNYYEIGDSSFTGELESDYNIIRQAKLVKATVVVLTTSFVTTQGSSTPLFLPNGLGGLNATTMYNQHTRYDQEAVFLRKRVEKPRFGITCQDLNLEQRKKFERNSGVMVRIVIEDSPAFDANIVPGDLMIAINENTIRGAAQATQLLESLPTSVDKVNFKIFRNGTERDVIVKLTDIK